MPFVQTRLDITRKDALGTAMQYMMGWFRGARQAFLWGAVQDLPSPPKSRLGRARHRVRQEWLQRQLVLPSNDLSASTMDTYLDQLEVFQPEWLQGYPHAPDLLARHAAMRGRRVSIPNITLTAEPTTSGQRERIAESFDAHVSTWYGAREHGWIAAECREERRLHINHVGLYIEQAEDGAVLVTDLLTHAMPLIRYELGDRVQLGTAPCPCGDPRPTIERLEGRVTDVLVLPSGKLVPGVLTSMRGLQHFVPGVIENQVVQNDLHSLDVYYVPAANFEPQHQQALAEDIRATTFGELDVRCHAVEALKRAPNGKVRYCVSHVERPHGDEEIAS